MFNLKDLILKKWLEFSQIRDEERGNTLQIWMMLFMGGGKVIDLWSIIENFEYDSSSIIIM